MAKPQITVRWNGANDEEYRESLAALDTYTPHPSIEASIAIKGIASERAVQEITAVARKYNADTSVTLKATWEEEDVDDGLQLRLFPVPEKPLSGTTVSMGVGDQMSEPVPVEHFNDAVEDAANRLAAEGIDPDTGEIRS